MELRLLNNVIFVTKEKKEPEFHDQRQIDSSKNVVFVSGKGDLFGEDISRKIPAKRSNGDVRALTYCDVYFITRERLQNVLHFYQDFAFKFSDNLELTYDLGASEVIPLLFSWYSLEYLYFISIKYQTHRLRVIIKGCRLDVPTYCQH